MTIKKYVKISLVILSMGIVFYLAYWPTEYFHSAVAAILKDSPFKKFLSRWWYSPLLTMFRQSILLKGVWLAFPATLALQWFFPADPNQKTLSISFIQDLVWFFYESILRAFVIMTYVVWIQSIYTHHFNFLTIESARYLPYWVRFIVGILLADFLYWVQHYLHHKVPFLWQLHTVHHSQKEINFFTDFRYHVLEYIVRNTVVTIPFLIFRINTPAIVAYSFFIQGWSRFTHGNVKMNLGPLKYILVTPQSHRIHHSVLPQHRDLNFGGIFSIWDYLFQLQYRKYDEYPPSGIYDEKFPLERSTRLNELLTQPLIQMFYPLKAIASLMKKRFISETPGN